MTLLHVPVKVGGPHEGSTALSLLTHQLGRPVSSAHVSLQTFQPTKLPSTARLLTVEGFLFLMDNLDVAGQYLLTPKLPFTARLLTDEGFLFLMDNLNVGGQVVLTPKVF